MKLINKFLILFVIFAVNVILLETVSAECKCRYNEDEGWFSDGYFDVIFDNDDFEVKNDDWKYYIVMDRKTSVACDTYVDPSRDKATIYKELNGKCQADIYVCDFKMLGLEDFQCLLFNETFHALLENNEVELGTGITYKKCKIVHLDADDSTCEPVNMVYPCNSYNDYDIVMTQAHDEYTKCVEEKGSGKCFVEHQEYLEAKDKITNYCNNIFDHLNESNSCTQSCLKLSDKIASWENKFDNTGNKCNLTARLVKYVRNILRWAKYIIPALVIILGMIDFIRAIGSNSDDEMKKAQQRFIKRLIAAVILFLLPLLIEFLLNAFRIDSTFCDFY